MRSIDALRSDTVRFDITGTTTSPNDSLVHSHFRNCAPTGAQNGKCVYYPPADTGFCGVMVSEADAYNGRVHRKSISFPVSSVIGFPLTNMTISPPLFTKEQLRGEQTETATGYYIKSSRVSKTEFISAIRMFKRGLELEKSKTQTRLVFPHNSKNEDAYIASLFPHIPFGFDNTYHVHTTHLYPQTNRDYALIEARKIFGLVPEDNRNEFIKSFEPLGDFQTSPSTDLLRWITDNGIRWWSNGDSVCLSSEDYTLYKVMTG